MTESEELKSLLMKVKEESEKVGWKLNIQKTKIMASGPISSWQIDGETMETVTDFIFLGSKITADGDCSHEIKRRLLFGRKAMTNLAAAAKSLQPCLTLCDPIDGSPPGSPIPGTLQARTLEWGAISFSNALEWKVKVKSLSRARLCDPMDCSPPGSSVHGIFQARVLEWGAIAFSKHPASIAEKLTRWNKWIRIKRTERNKKLDGALAVAQRSNNNTSLK